MISHCLLLTINDGFVFTISVIPGPKIITISKSKFTSELLETLVKKLTTLIQIKLTIGEITYGFEFGLKIINNFHIFFNDQNFLN